MTKKVQQPPPSGWSVADVVYLLFKHKWKLTFISLLGLAGAAAYYFTAPATYFSEAKLMVRYVVERSAVDQVQNTTSLSANQGADSVIQSEIEILTSWDLAEKVSSMPGLEGLVPKSKPPATPAAGARWISQNLKVSAGKGSNVLFVSFRHPDPVLARAVLDQLVQLYFIKHLEIHRSKEAAKFVTDKVESSRTKLRGAEDELTKLKTESGILSLPETLETLNAECAQAQADLNAAEAELAEQRARVAAYEQLGVVGDRTLPGSEAAAETTMKAIVPPGRIAKPAATARGAAASSASSLEVSRPDSDYATALSSLKLMESERQQMLKVYREEHEAVKLLDEKIARQRAAVDIYKEQSTEESTRQFQTDLQTERAHLLAIEAKAQKLRETLAAAQKNAAAFTTIMPRITEKELTRDIEIGNYKYMAASLEKAQVDEALDGSKMPNISIVQEATPALPDLSKRKKIAVGIAGGTSGMAIAITLLFGLILNKTVNRSEELEERLGLPVVLSIPYFNRRERLRPRYLRGANNPGALNPNDRLRLSHPKGANSPNGDDSKQAPAPSRKQAPAAVAPWEIGHFIRPYSEAVRDRLGLYFEINGIIHKPRLIGVTGFSHGAGTSTLAAGLAAALSETGEGKVLMVDMTANGSEGEVHPFFAGRPAVALDDALKSAGQIPSTAENLYLATAEPNSAGSGSLGLNKFRRIMRELKASDFDYMVFDMPALGQTSSSAAMAGLMDQVLVIVESETSSPEEVKRGFRDLADSRAKVSLVFNKAKSYGPKSLVGGR